jgi:hypothetical protein
MGYQNLRVKIETIDAQDSAHGSIVVLISGIILQKSESDPPPLFLILFFICLTS